MTRTKALELAIEAATEYARTHTAESGRLDQLRRTIDDLVGQRNVRGQWTLPAVVRRAMRGQ